MPQKFQTLLSNQHFTQVPDLFDEDETEEIIGAGLNMCKQAGIPDSRENAWTIFIDTVRRNLKVSCDSVQCL